MTPVNRNKKGRLLMSLTKEIREIVGTQNQQAKCSNLADLAFRFEMDQSLLVDEMIDAVSQLLAYALAEKDQGLKDGLYNVVDDALFYRHLGKYIDWSSLVAQLPLLKT